MVGWNQSRGINSILLGYSLGKAQRLINGLDQNIGKVYTHGAVENINIILRENNIKVNSTQYMGLKKL